MGKAMSEDYSTGSVRILTEQCQAYERKIFNLMAAVLFVVGIMLGFAWGLMYQDGVVAGLKGDKAVLQQENRRLDEMVNQARKTVIFP